jgi:hypothetical protein
MTYGYSQAIGYSEDKRLEDQAKAKAYIVLGHFYLSACY